MAKHRRREQEPSMNDNINNNNMMNSNNNPFGIDPMQLLGLLGGNFDMRNMSNMLASMNTNGFNLNNLGPLAQMAGLNLDNNFTNGNNNLNRNNNNSNVATDMQNMSASNLNKNEANTQKHDEVRDKRNNTKMTQQEQMKQNEAVTHTQTQNKTRDENLEFLISLRSFVHQSKIPFVDRIIDGYKKGLFK
ncbi:MULTISPECIES: hypothetical protein [Clostridium]|uniref:Uncharacterized protein n=2 Tax=Clostridium butyricum TaxID=1492 RepID=C4IKL7_CLOBU|nr:MULTISPECIES: hypothetical protein [Clostridium]ALP91131.1 hypothetical protein ATN24_13620 [Clostridium butyricum]ALS17631.1 hypothetical protein ATD26_12350 [Clostridium butyricum]ANF14754.1 hypothetical protein AZ909_12075 [Clostridium butyricum]AOR94821.1 hypothetical protein BBB49_12260 [Clostridium butyricum]APF24879.1 hypothetical protein NPD4_2768 [Clostridium butyricum]